MKRVNDLIKAIQTEMVHLVPKDMPLPLFQDADSAAQLALGQSLKTFPRETPGDVSTARRQED